MHQFGKIINNNVHLCPKNGYVNGIAISNLNIYFNTHPEIAKQEGYYPIVELEGVVEQPIEFKLINDKIYEVIIEEE